MERLRDVDIQGSDDRRVCLNPSFRLRVPHDASGGKWSTVLVHVIENLSQFRSGLFVERAVDEKVVGLAASLAPRVNFHGV